jgi:hypothetical protein
MKKFKQWIKRNWLLVFFGFLTVVVILFPWRNLDGVELWGYRLHTWNYNELGDFVGGITTPVLSFIGVFLLYKTYISQRTELKATKKALRLQQSTTSLFSMINVLENILSNLEEKVLINLDQMEEAKGGRELINYFYGQIKFALKDIGGNYRYNLNTNLFDEYEVTKSTVTNTMDALLHNTQPEIENEMVQTSSSITVEKYRGKIRAHIVMFFEKKEKGKNLVALTPYFRYIESIIDFIDKQFVTQKEKDFYYKVFSSQFSNEELGLIYYYSMSFYQKTLFSKLVKSRFLRHLEGRSLPEREHLNIYRSRILHPQQQKAQGV